MSTTREECIADAGEAYGAMLADPVMKQKLLAARARKAAAAAAAAESAATQTADGSLSPRGNTRARRPHTTRT